jgi:hypothetical protein
MRSYENFTLGLSMLLFAVAIARAAPIPRAIACLMGLSGVAYLLQGWVAGSEGFSETHTIAIVTTEALNLAWMVWLLVFSRTTEKRSPHLPQRPNNNARGGM